MPLRPELKEAMNVNWERNEEAYRYLADTEKSMPSDPSLYTTHAIDTHPLRLHEGAVVGVGSRWARQAMSEIAALEAELANRREAIAKLSEATVRQCDTIMEQTRKLAKKDAMIETLHGTQQQANDALNNLHQRLSEADETIASIRSQLARVAEAGRAFANEASQIAVFSGNTLKAYGEFLDALAIASPGPSVTPEWEPKCPWSPEGITALRAAGGSDWDKIADVRAFLGRDEDEKLSRLLESVLAAIEEYNSNFAHMTYKDDAMKAMVKAYADYVATEAHS